MPRTGLIFGGAPAVPDMVAVARRAEERGFESVWVAETRLTRDAIVPAAAIAAATERIRVGTGIVNVYTRGPVVLALSFRTLDEIAPGRIIAGLGAGSPFPLARQGVAFERPLRRLREHCEVMRPLLRGESVTFEGQTISLDEARIEDILAAGGGPGSADVPLYLGVTGPKAVELAGELADGALLNICLPTEYVERSLERIATGARAANRSPDDVEVAMAIVVSPHEDGDEGRNRARPFIGLYLALFPNVARETGLPATLIDAIRTAFATGGLPAAAALVTDDIVNRLCAAGTPAECRARIDAYREYGVALPVLTPVDGALDLAVETLA